MFMNERYQNCNDCRHIGKTIEYARGIPHFGVLFLFVHQNINFFTLPL
ncbi:hypothetical protein EDO6_03725 [Paenibacillus xylanexedens]|nr:hypothetical protein EDO6_03725 [Paenibacillus xylanexedens]